MHEHKKPIQTAARNMCTEQETDHGYEFFLYGDTDGKKHKHNIKHIFTTHLWGTCRAHV